MKIHEYFKLFKDFDLSPYLNQLSCSVIVTNATGDPLAHNAVKLYDNLKNPKKLVTFTVEEGAGDHCETLSRAVYHQRIGDLLNEILHEESI